MEPHAASNAIRSCLVAPTWCALQVEQYTSQIRTLTECAAVGTFVAAREDCTNINQTRPDKKMARPKSKDKGQSHGAPTARPGLTADGKSTLVAVEPLGWMNADNALVTLTDGDSAAYFYAQG